jgi:DNA-binding MltR family transcriptional regulator
MERITDESSTATTMEVMVMSVRRLLRQIFRQASFKVSINFN